MAPPKDLNSRQRTKLSNGNKTKTLLIMIVVIAVIGLVYFFTNNGKSKKAQVSKSQIENLGRLRICKVFIENSGSMDGYVAPVNSQLKTDINALVSGINPDSVALNYINSSIIPIKAERISDFTEGLSIKSFQMGGGDRKNTSLQDILGKIQECTQAGEVSILVSDMILSLKSGQSPESVSANIETMLRKQLELRPEWSIVVWRMLSDYEGKYYHNAGVPSTRLQGVKRPYFILMMGDRNDLRRVIAKGQIPENSPLFRNRTHSLCFEPACKYVEYHLSPNAILGSLRLDPQDNHTHTIAEAERGASPDGKKGFAFEYVIKRPALLQSEESMQCLSNYELQPNNYNVERITFFDRGEKLKLRVRASSVVRGNVTLYYKQPMPTWFTAIHSEQNEDIYAERAMEQTYGISYILEGLRRPYETVARHLLTMPIRIN